MSWNFKYTTGNNVLTGNPEEYDNVWVYILTHMITQLSFLCIEIHAFFTQHTLEFPDSYDLNEVLAFGANEAKSVAYWGYKQESQHSQFPFFVVFHLFVFFSVGETFLSLHKQHERRKGNSESIKVEQSGNLTTTSMQNEMSHEDFPSPRNFHFLPKILPACIVQFPWDVVLLNSQTSSLLLRVWMLDGSESNASSTVTHLAAGEAPKDHHGSDLSLRFIIHN